MAQVRSDKWDLRRCIEYARVNNISVKQADVQARISALQERQSRMGQYPGVSANTGTGVRFGRSIDPTTNSFSTTQFLYQNFGVNAGLQLYNAGGLKNTLLASEFTAKAALAEVERTANDISLNVANFYLQVLAASEQVKITQVQIAQSISQLDITRKRVDAGALPELNLAEVEAQLANDSSNYVAAVTTLQLNILNLKGMLSLDPAVAFEVDMPPVDQIPVESFGELQPELVYQLALTTQPLQKANDFRIKAAQKNILAARALMYPTVNLGVNLSSNFSNSFKKLDGVTFLGYSPVTGAEPIVRISNVEYYVQNPLYRFSQSTRGFGDLWQGWSRQLSDNFGQNVGVSISVPIFNSGQGKIAHQRSKLNLKTVELQKEQADLKLKQDIYTAYNNATAALQKFNAGKKQVESAQKAYDYAMKRYEVGLLGSLDLITNQNTLLRAKVQQLSNQYDYVFKMKVLEFYKGQGLKL
ncbi:MAG: TolC family protein [Chitinophagaceae bacterium]|nr:TolC family protein [Chitinophagaceae bacterium]